MSNKIIDTIEKFLRYFVPGLVFVFLFDLSFPNVSQNFLEKIGDIKFALIILSIGVIIYGIYRRIVLVFILELPLYLLNCEAISNFRNVSKKGIKKLFDYPRARAEFFKERHNYSDINDSKKNLSSYLYYRWALHHYLFIFFMQLILFSYFSNSTTIIANNKCWLTVISIIGLVIIFAQLVGLYITEKNIYPKNHN